MIKICFSTIILFSFFCVKGMDIRQAELAIKNKQYEQQIPSRVYELLTHMERAENAWTMNDSCVQALLDKTLTEREYQKVCHPTVLYEIDYPSITYFKPDGSLFATLKSKSTKIFESRFDFLHKIEVLINVHNGLTGLKIRDLSYQFQDRYCGEPHVGWSPDGAIVFLQTELNKFTTRAAWRLKDGQLMSNLKASKHVKSISCRYILQEDSILDCETGMPVITFDNGRVQNACCSPNQVFVALDEVNQTRVVNLSNKETVATLDGQCPVFSPNNRYLVLRSTETPGIIIFDMITKTKKNVSGEDFSKEPRDDSPLVKRLESGPLLIEYSISNDSKITAVIIDFFTLLLIDNESGAPCAQKMTFPKEPRYYIKMHPNHEMLLHGTLLFKKDGEHYRYKHNFDKDNHGYVYPNFSPKGNFIYVDDPKGSCCLYGTTDLELKYAFEKKWRFLEQPRLFSSEETAQCWDKVIDLLPVHKASVKEILALKVIRNNLANKSALCPVAFSIASQSSNKFLRNYAQQASLTCPVVQIDSVPKPIATAETQVATSYSTATAAAAADKKPLNNEKAQ